MFIKLMKYDLLYGLKRYGILFILLAGSWLFNLAATLVGNRYLNTIVVGLHMLVSIFLVCSYIITCLQFVFGSLSGDESYFNYSIPTGTFSLLLSKLLTLWLWGAAAAGGLVLSWLSIITAADDMQTSFTLSDEVFSIAIPIVVAQFMLLSCLLFFAAALFNTPRLRNLNAGAVVVAVVTYGLAQLIGLLEIGAFLLLRYNADGELSFLNRELTMANDRALLEELRNVLTIAPLLLSILFFLFAVRTLRSKRSI